MENTAWKALVETMKKYIRAGKTLEDYNNEVGWDDWMDEYTDAADREEVSELELKEIHRIEQLAWEVAQTQIDAEN